MYQKIMIPVDLEYADQLEKALAICADLAKLYNAELFVVGVSVAAPSAFGRDPTGHAHKLESFAAEQTQKRGVQFVAKAVTTPDPVGGLDNALKKAAAEIETDLVVMASHVPGFFEHIVASHAGYVASHTGLSVFVVR